MITLVELQAVVDRINRLTNSPAAPYTRQGDKLIANIGCYHLDHDPFGKVSLARINNEGGGISQPLGFNSRTKRELYVALHDFIAGLGVSPGEEQDGNV